ncbi:uncharacterized protein LOC115464288 [Microcaecilia unicolor]|uniref:Uncharacterized protein LOC115464288 n=1 Tax=Microcaecilia unicolor TaxID=1415580 RepID=A0A6P7XB53_9AMPH|nr:uncharacterized protein LOC115464288 [Microcaecilia unicolor]
MNNCDLEKFAISGGKLEPPFQPQVTHYKAIVASNVPKISLDLLTADNGASYNILGGDGSRVISLKEGINTICIEVTAEDGTTKKYVLEVTKLSSSCASLQGLKLSEDLQLLPSFASNVYEYSSTVPYYLSNISIQASISDSKMKVTVNGTDALKPVPLCTGDTLIEVLVFSADGTKSQVYQVIVTRLQLPCFISFTDVSDQTEYECPVSLTALYRPVSIRGSEPKHTFSAPYIDLLTRRLKIDPLDETLLGENWRLPEYELDIKISRATVHCCYAYRGCSSILKLSELGLHAKDCTCKPSPALDAQDVTESKWYKEHVASVQKPDHRVKHVIQFKKRRKIHEERKCRVASATLWCFARLVIIVAAMVDGAWVCITRDLLLFWQMHTGDFPEHQQVMLGVQGILIQLSWRYLYVSSEHVSLYKLEFTFSDLLLLLNLESVCTSSLSCG